MGRRAVEPRVDRRPGAFQQFVTGRRAAPDDGDDANDYIAFCNGEVGMMPAPGWKPGQIINPDDGCPDMEANIGVFAMPGSTAGTTAPVFLGGSNLAISANSEQPGARRRPADRSWSSRVPGRSSPSGHDPALEVAAGCRSAAATAPGPGRRRREQPLRAVERELGGRRGGQHPARHGRRHRQGGDIAGEAERADAAIEEILNSSVQTTSRHSTRGREASRQAPPSRWQRGRRGMAARRRPRPRLGCRLRPARCPRSRVLG